MRDIDTLQLVHALEQGLPYLDVRTEEEFSSGHIPGAYNIPYFERLSPAALPNEDFFPLILSTFTKEMPLVIGCQSGVRSARAARWLEAQGFINVLNFSGGFGGGRDPFGTPIEGWNAKGRNISRTPQVGRSYRELKAKSSER